MAVGGRGDEDDPLAEALIGHADGDRVPDEAGRVGGLLDLGRADAVAGGLDHVVAPTHIEEEALFVRDDGVPRPDGALGGAPRLDQAGYLGGGGGVVDQGAAGRPGSQAAVHGGVANAERLRAPGGTRGARTLPGQGAGQAQGREGSD